MHASHSWWFWTGTASFLLLGLGAGLGSFNSNYVEYSLLGLFDWLAVSVLYFFYGALLGLGIDYLSANYKKRTFRLPFWFYCTLCFIVLSIIVALIRVQPDSLSAFLRCLAYPFYYGVLFLGYSFFTFFPTLIITLTYLKLILNLMFLGLFGTWLYREYSSQSSPRWNTLLILIIFVILLVGMIAKVTGLVF